MLRKFLLMILFCHTSERITEIVICLLKLLWKQKYYWDCTYRCTLPLCRIHFTYIHTNLYSARNHENESDAQYRNACFRIVFIISFE